MVENSLKMVREICLQLPEVVEKPSHGAPSWFVQGKRQFATFWDNHHNDGRLALWIAAPMGVQQSLDAAAKAWFFVPPYVGYRGWIGVRLDRDLTREELEDLLYDAFCTVVPPKLIEKLRAAKTEV